MEDKTVNSVSHEILFISKIIRKQRRRCLTEICRKVDGAAYNLHKKAEQKRNTRDAEFPASFMFNPYSATCYELFIN